MRQIWARRRLLPDESGVPVAVTRCAYFIDAHIFGFIKTHLDAPTIWPFTITVM